MCWMAVIWRLPGCTEGANYKFKIECGMKMRIIKAKSENNLQYNNCVNYNHSSSSSSAQISSDSELSSSILIFTVPSG